MKRVFIIAPMGNYDEDVLHIVAKTKNNHNSYMDIYIGDDYEEIFTTDNLKDAIKVAKKNGAKRPYVLA